MLSKNQRLARESIREILRKGKTVRNNGISLKYLVKPDGQKAFAFIVSAKTVKKAVNRNLLKRRGRAVVFKLLPRIKKGLLALVFFERGSQRFVISQSGNGNYTNFSENRPFNLN